MKIFKDITNWPNKYLLKYIQKLCFVMFGIGLMTGFAIIMAGIASKNNDFDKTMVLIGIALFFLFLLALLYTFVHKKVVPELEKRLKDN